MYNDSITRQLECFLNNGGTTQELKSLLSTSRTDKEFLEKLLNKNKQ